MLSEHGMTIAPQTYYRWLACPVRPAELEEAYLVNEIVDLYRRNKCVYGVRKMWHAARRAGLVRRAGSGRPADADRGHPRRAPRGAPYRHDDPGRARASAPGPGQAGLEDAEPAGCGLGRGLHVRVDRVRFLYVSFVTDVYSRRILGWRASMSKTSDLVIAALAQAFATRRRTSSEFTAKG